MGWPMSTLKWNKNDQKPICLNGSQTVVVVAWFCAGANGNPCGGFYIGETGRTLKSHVDDYFSTALRCPGQCKLSVMQHARDFNHHFRKDDFKIIDFKENNFCRGVKASSYGHSILPSMSTQAAICFLPTMITSSRLRWKRRPHLLFTTLKWRLS